MPPPRRAVMGLAHRKQVYALPTCILFKGGKAVERETPPCPPPPTRCPAVAGLSRGEVAAAPPY